MYAALCGSHAVIRVIENWVPTIAGIQRERTEDGCRDFFRARRSQRLGRRCYRPRPWNPNCGAIL